MKRISIFGTLLLIVLVVAACGSSNSKSSSAATPSAPATNAITPTMELAVGTLRLEGTSQAVDQELAVQLIPYWQLMEELNSNPAAAPQEITAIVENMRALMTAEQIKAIEDMQLTRSDVVAASQAAVSGSSVSNTNTNANGMPQVFARGGQDGPPPGGGGGLMGQGGIEGASIIASSSQQSASSSQSPSSADTASLIEQVIKLLESRTKK